MKSNRDKFELSLIRREQFGDWIREGNAYHDGNVWREQSSQYMIPFKTLAELYRYFIKEFIKI